MGSKKWNTPFTDRFGCRLPVMGAPMAGVSGGALAFQTSRAGGCGTIAAGHLINEQALEQLEREIGLFRELSDGSTSPSPPLCIGFIGHSTFGRDSPGWEYVRRILEKHRPESVQVFAPAISTDAPAASSASPSFGTNVEMCQSFGCRVIAQVCSVECGIAALDAGVDCLVAQGTEAGGHGFRRELGNGTLSLTRRLVRLAAERERRVPVLAAGGITDGRGLVAALGLGADGAVLGTRLWASREALGPPAYKNALVKAGSCDDVVRTQVFDTICNSHRETKWPYPFDSSGTLRNDTTEAWDTSIPELEARLKSSDDSGEVEKLNRAEAEELPDLGCVYSGQGVGEIGSIDPAYEILIGIEAEAIDCLKTLAAITTP